MSSSTKHPEKPRRKGQTQISVWCSDKIVAAIDKRKAGMQEGKMRTIHRSDVIRAVLAKEFGVIEDEDGLEG